MSKERERVIELHRRLVRASARLGAFKAGEIDLNERWIKVIDAQAAREAKAKAEGNHEPA